MFASARTSVARIARTRQNAKPSMGALRFLNVHEGDSMELFQANGIKTPKFQMVTTPEEAENAFLNTLNTRKFR